jgi:hypothetical protein
VITCRPDSGDVGSQAAGHPVSLVRRAASCWPGSRRWRSSRPPRG